MNPIAKVRFPSPSLASRSRAVRGRMPRLWESDSNSEAPTALLRG